MLIVYLLEKNGLTNHTGREVNLIYCLDYIILNRVEVRNVLPCLEITINPTYEFDRSSKYIFTLTLKMVF